MTGLIIVAVIIALGLIAFLIRKYVPAFKGDNKDKQSRKEIAEENVNMVVVDPEKDITSKEEKKASLRKEIKKIKQESLTEEEENEKISELLEKSGYDEDSLEDEE